MTGSLYRVLHDREEVQQHSETAEQREERLKIKGEIELGVLFKQPSSKSYNELGHVNLCDSVNIVTRDYNVYVWVKRFFLFHTHAHQVYTCRSRHIQF